MNCPRSRVTRYLRVALAPIGLAVLCGCASFKTSGQALVNGNTVAYSQAGNGTATVVFQAGLGDGKTVWNAVIRALGPAVSTFAYDRPGYGQSPRTSEPRDPCSIAREQRRVLANAGLRPPYVLVGHSLGGLYEYVYARLYPEEVAGVVLLDPTHPDHFRRMQRDVPTMATMLKVTSKLFPATMRSEYDAQAQCIETIVKDRPLQMRSRLLVRSRFPLIEKGAFERMTRRLAEDWQRLTGVDQIEVVPKSGHYIQKDRPDVVARAIAAVLADTAH